MSGRRAREALRRRLRFERECRDRYSLRGELRVSVGYAVCALVRERRRLLGHCLCGVLANRLRESQLERDSLRAWHRAKIRAQLSKRGRS